MAAAEAGRAPARLIGNIARAVATLVRLLARYGDLGQVRVVYEAGPTPTGYGLQRELARRWYQELGLGHFEGRSWRGLHHHATLCVAAYAFLLAQRIATPKRESFASSDIRPSACPTRRLPAPRLPCEGSATFRTR